MKTESKNKTNINKEARGNDKKDPDVEIFGECVEPEKKEHECHGSLAWGLTLILVGIVLLLLNLGILPSFNWGMLVKFWPVIIILIGVDILVGRSDLVSSLVGLFIFTTILGVAFIYISPQLVSSLPQGIQNYLYSINNHFLIK